jgi:hypothetical protein
MAHVSLLNTQDPNFAFEHWNVHRQALGVMSPLTRFSLVPYFLDPIQDPNQPAGPWHLNHQQAHNDAENQLPTTYTSRDSGVNFGSNLVDTNLSHAWNRSWWTFQNHLEHYVGNNTILPATDLYYEVIPDPIPDPPNPPIQPPPYWVQYRTWTFPFW